MLSSPTQVIVGATSLRATLDMLAAYGFTVRASGDVPVFRARARYGLDDATSWTKVTQAGADVGALRIVETPHPAPPRTDFDRGPLAIDVYARDADEAAAIADAHGWDRGPVGTIELGPLVMRQVEVTAPDGWRLVFVEANRRRPSLLDTREDLRFSEVHSVLWSVDDIAQANPPFVAGGLVEQHLFPVGIPAVAEIMRLPEERHDLRMNLLTDEPQRPIRLELFEFSADPGPTRPNWPLTGGIFAPVFDVDDLDATIDAMGLDAGARVEDQDGEAVSCTTATGIRLELRHR